MARDTPMTSAERREIARVIAQDKAKAKARKRAASGLNTQTAGPANPKPASADELRDIKANVVAGGVLKQIDPLVRQSAGIGSPVSKDSLLGKTASNLVDAATGFPGGMYEFAKAAAADTRDTVQGKYVRDPGRKSALEPILKGVAESTMETVKHPLRRPGDTLLLGLGAAGAAGSAGSRVAAASNAAKVAKQAGKSPVRQALARPRAEGGSLAHLPAPPKRELRSGDLTVRSRYSNNVPLRIAQQAYDRATNSQPGEHRIARELAAEQRVTNAADRAPSNALANAGKRLTEPQQMALRVYHEGAPVESVIETHKANLAKSKGSARRRLAHRIGVLEAAKSYVQTVDGKPTLRADFDRPSMQVRPRSGYVAPRRGVGPKALQAISDRIERVAGDHPGGRQAVLKEMGLLTDESASSRVNAPGRMAMGATYVKPTDQRLGVETRALKDARVRVASLERRYTATLERARGKEVERPNVHTRTGFKKANLKTAPELAFRRQQTEVAPGPRTPGVPSALPPQGLYTESVKRLGSALGVARDELQALEARQAKGVQDTGLVGSEDFTGGRTRIPDSPVRQPSAQTKPSLFRGGIPKKPGSLTHGYTGRLRETGNYRTDTTRLVAESGVEAQRYTSVEKLRQRVVQAGKRERPDSGDWVPVKTQPLSKANSAKLRNILGAETDPQRMSVADKGRYDHAIDELKAQAFPDAKDFAHVEPGTVVEGVVWVPKKLLDGVNAGGGRILNTGTREGRAIRAFDTVQNVVKAVILYAKPGYLAPNVVGNATFNLIQQGYHAPGNWKAALNMDGRFGEDVTAGVREIMGAGKVQSLARGTDRGKLTRAVNTTGNAWSRVTDDTFRTASFLHEAKKAGYKRTQADLERLLFSQESRGDLVEISGRAKSSIVDYERMGPVERDIVRRVLFVYPWVKGATVAGGHFLAEHPVQAAAVSQVSGVGREQGQLDLGDMPSWARGLFKVGGTARQPLVVNPAGINNFATPAQTLTTAAGLLGGDVGQTDSLANMLSPTLTAALEAATKRDSFSGAPLEGSPPEIFGKQILKGVPQHLLYERIKGSDEDQSDRAYPYTTATAIGQFVGGSAAPRFANRDVLNDRAKREVLAKMSPGQRASRRVFDERAEFLDAAKFAMPKSLENGRLPKNLRDAFNVEAERQVLYAKAVDGKQEATADYHWAKYQADLKLLVKHGLVTKQRAAQVLTAAEGAGLDDLKRARQAISERYYQAEGGQLYYIGHARKALADAGAPLSSR